MRRLLCKKLLKKECIWQRVYCDMQPRKYLPLPSDVWRCAAEAMNTLIYRVLGASDEELRNVPSESNAIELARLLFFLCVAAYNMRTIEMRCAT